MAGVLLPQSRREFALEVVYCSNYRKVRLSVTVKYDERSGEDEPCCCVDHRSYMAGRFYTQCQRQIKIKSRSFGPLCDRRNENWSALFRFHFHLAPKWS